MTLRPHVRLASLLVLASVVPCAVRAAEPAADVPDYVSLVDAPADRALQEGRVDEATALLSANLAANPNDAVAHQLLCRVFYSEELADRAIHECELAVANAPRSSDDQLWLGRAYGLKARHANPLASYSLAKKVHASFEQAVQLNPGNPAAIGDLGEYYIDAPSMLGGGADKARALVARAMPRFPVEAHRLLALIAQDASDYTLAEAEFKNAVAARDPAPTLAGHASIAHNNAGAWIDLARFYESRKRFDDAVAAIRSALAADPIHDAALVDAASILTEMHREPQLAERALRDYLASAAKSDEAPAFKVHLQLSKLLAKRGDTASANHEFEAASAMAAAFSRSAPGV